MPALDPATGASNWPKAEKIADWINLDWKNPDPNILDLSLEKYLGITNNPKNIGLKPKVKDVWDNYLKYHLVGKKASTIACYEKYTNKLKPWLEFPVERETAYKIRADFIKNNPQINIKT